MAQSTADGAPRQTTSAPQRRILRLRDRSEVSLILKGLIFAFNFLIWLIGVLLLGVGIWAAREQSGTPGVESLSTIFFDPVTIILIAGSIVFLVGFVGCIGALRENIIFLAIYIAVVVILFALFVAGAVILFGFRDWLKDKLLEPLEKAIVMYREERYLDLKNLIDWVQSDWLHCCGLEDYDDWEKNIYFNCSSPGSEACGVPSSCCQPNEDPTLPFDAVQCGFGVRAHDNRLNVEASKTIYMKGCIEQGDAWFQQYMVPIAGVIVGVAVVQILGICCVCNLYSDIRRQKAKWRYQ